MNIDYPCICGHERNAHVMDNTETEGWCRYEDAYNPGVACHWHVFIGDNLKYLERLSAKR